MNPETIPKTERMWTPQETAEAIQRLKSIPEKVKLLDGQMRAAEQEALKNPNSPTYAEFGNAYAQYEAMKKSIIESMSAPTFGSEEVDNALRSSFPIEKAENAPAPSASIELDSEEAAEVPPNASVFATAPSESASVIPPAIAEDPKLTQARALAEKIKTHPHGILSLDENEEKFKNENYDIVSQAMIEANAPKKTEAEILGDALSASRSEYAKAKFLDSKNPTPETKAALENLQKAYMEKILEGQKKINEHTSDPKFYFDSIRDEKRAYNREYLGLYAKDVKDRVEKTLKKVPAAVGNAALYSALLGVKLVDMGIDAAGKGIDKLKSGNGKAIDFLKKWSAERYKIMKESAKATDPKANILDTIIGASHGAWGGKTGTRWFEKGSNSQKETDKKIAKAEKKTVAEESKKAENGDTKKTPEQIEKASLKNFLTKSFESGSNGQLTEKENKDAFKAWEKYKKVPVADFMEPEKADWGKDENGKDIKKTVSDYSKSEQGLQKKLKNAYEDAVYKKIVNEKTTVEEFIKMSIKNGSLN